MPPHASKGPKQTYRNSLPTSKIVKRSILSWLCDINIAHSRDVPFYVFSSTTGFRQAEILQFFHFFVDAVLRKSVLALSEQFKNMSGDLICFAFQDNRKESFGF